MNIKFKKNLTIKEEIFYTILFISIITLIIFGSFFSYSFITANRQKSLESLKCTNTIINTYIEGHIREVENTINVLSQSPDIINAGGNNYEARKRALKIYKTFAATNKNIGYIYSGYKNGSLLINDYTAPAWFNSTKRPWYINALNSRTKTTEWTLYREAVSTEWEISASKVLLNPAGDHTGVVAIDINIKDLENLLSIKKSFETEHSYIIDKTGRIIVHPDESIINTQIPEVISQIPGEEGNLEYCILHGRANSYYSTIPHTGWVIITAIDPWEIRRPIVLHLLTFLTIVVMLSLMLGIFSNKIFLKRFAEPLIELNRRVQAITSGETHEENSYQYSNYETAVIAENIEKLAKDAIRKSEEKYSLIADNIADTVTIFDLQLNITFVSPSIYRLRGFTVDEAMKQTVAEILTPESLKISSEALARELEVENRGESDPGRSLLLDLEEYKKDGTIIWVENRISFIRDKDNKASEILVVSRDITDRKKAEDSLREAKRQAEDANIAKSQFLAGMSHEIRTPLNAILGMTDLSLMTDSDDLVREYLAIVKRSGNHLLKILNDILDFSKIEAGNLLLEKREFPLSQIFLSIDNFFRIDIEKKGIEFKINTAEDLPPHIIGDEVRIRQMIMNLVSNASKFTESGTITLDARICTVDSEPDLIPLEISVTDTGCGIDPEKLNIIFSKFQQAEMSTSRKYGGSGLGLSIVKELASLMNGTITVESEKGKGSKFTLIFFVEKPRYSSGIPETETHTVKKAGDNPELKILLAEDDEINIRLAVTLLKKLGDNVTVARNGLEVIEKLKNNSFDLILMDIEMPEMDGIEATLQIRSGRCGHEKSNTPIIAMTAHAVSDVKQKGLESGMNDYITKPIDITQINEKILAVINK